mgnify:FL=1
MMDVKCCKILFVCLGHICRSQSAEAIHKHIILQRDDSSEWEIDSAGILYFHEGRRRLRDMKFHTLTGLDK